MNDLTDAVREYLRALDSSRSMYVQTARNGPSAGEVKAGKAARLRRAEDHLRETLEAHDG